MIYSNEKFISEPRTFDFGTIYRIGLGQIDGLFASFTPITCPKKLVIEKGMNYTLTIGKTRTGKIRINNYGNDEKGYMYMLISSNNLGEKSYPLNEVYILKKNEDYELLAKGEGSDYIDGDGEHFWDCVLLKVPSAKAIVRVKRSFRKGHNYDDIYIVKNGRVYDCKLGNIRKVSHDKKLDISSGFYTLENNDIQFCEFEWERV